MVEYDLWQYIAAGLGALAILIVFIDMIRRKAKKIDLKAKEDAMKTIPKPVAKQNVMPELTPEESSVLTARPTTKVDDKVDELKQAIKDEIKADIIDRFFK